MADAIITIMDNGPLLVKGPIMLLDGKGKPYASKKTVALCRCGLSANKPFCDGAHSDGFQSQARAE